MTRINHDKNILTTGAMDGKIDYHKKPARFIAQIREGIRQYKVMYKKECVPESRICGIMLLLLPKLYDGVVKRMGTKPPETELTLQMVQEALITAHEHNHAVSEPKHGVKPTFSNLMSVVESKEALGTKEGLKPKSNPKLAQHSVQRIAASAALKIKQCDNCGKRGHTLEYLLVIAEG